MKDIPELRLGQKYRVGDCVWQIVSLTGDDPAYPIVMDEVETSERLRKGWADYYDRNPDITASREEFVARLRRHETEPRWFLRPDVKAISD